MLFAIKTQFYKFLMVILKVVVKLMAAPKPTVFFGPGSSLRLCDTIFQFGMSKILIVTDKDLSALGLLDGVKKTLDQKGIECIVYDGVAPNPTFSHVREGLDLVKKYHCDGVLAFGGGSPIDAAKVISLAANNTLEPEKFVGFTKAKRPPLPLFAVPTTAGTGSEVTIAAVISDPVSHAKNNVIEPKIVPLAVALDPDLMTGLPPHITAATGIDALTHAVEAYISKIATENSDAYAEIAVRMIFKNLKTTYHNGTDLNAREAMALASFYAGLAFTQAGTGYVHAIAHQLGRFYDIPHGMANSMVLPYILKYSKDAIEKRLARLAVVIGAGSESERKSVLAQKFIDAVIDLNRELAIPETVDRIRQKDIPEIVKGAFKEAHYTYGVPKYMDSKTCNEMIQKMAGTTEA